MLTQNSIFQFSYKTQFFTNKQALGSEKRSIKKFNAIHTTNTLHNQPNYLCHLCVIYQVTLINK